MYFRCLD